MRYYAEPRRTRYIFPPEFRVATSFISFANDYVHFVMEHHGLRWRPRCVVNQVIAEDKARNLVPLPRLYTPSPLSYFTWRMLTATRYILGNRTDDYRHIFRKLVPKGTEDGLERFVDTVHDMHSELLRKGATPCEVLFGLASVGRLIVLFYKHGVVDAVHIAPWLISDFMAELNEYCKGEVFDRLDYYAGEVTSWFEKDKDKRKENGL